MNRSQLAVKAARQGCSYILPSGWVVISSLLCLLLVPDKPPTHHQLATTAASQVCWLDWGMLTDFYAHPLDSVDVGSLYKLEASVESCRFTGAPPLQPAILSGKCATGYHLKEAANERIIGRNSVYTFCRGKGASFGCECSLLPAPFMKRNQYVLNPAAPF